MFQVLGYSHTLYKVDVKSGYCYCPCPLEPKFLEPNNFRAQFFDGKYIISEPHTLYPISMTLYTDYTSF